MRESRCHTTGPVESTVQGTGRGESSNSKQQKRRRKSRGNPEKRKPETQSGRWTWHKLKDPVSDEYKSQEKFNKIFVTSVRY